MEELFSEIEKKVNSREDLIFYLEEIDRASELILKNPNKKLAEKLKTKISGDLFKILIKLEQKKKNKDFQGLISFLDSLRDYLSSLSQVKLEIAFLPQEETIAKINRWFEKELKKKVVLDIRVNSRIGGGAIIEYQGKLANFSLVQEIKKIKLSEVVK